MSLPNPPQQIAFSISSDGSAVNVYSSGAVAGQMALGGIPELMFVPEDDLMFVPEEDLMFA